MKDSLLLKKYKTENVNGTLNLDEEKTFFGTKVMDIEDEIGLEFENMERVIARERKLIALKDETISQKDEALSQKDETISQKDEALAQKDRELEELRKLLEK